MHRISHEGRAKGVWQPCMTSLSAQIECGQTLRLEIADWIVNVDRHSFYRCTFSFQALEMICIYTQWTDTHRLTSTG